MDFTRCVNVCWRRLPKNEDRGVLQSEIETLCRGCGLNDATMESMWRIVGPDPTIDFTTFEVVLGLVSQAQRKSAMDSQTIEPTMPPPTIPGITDGHDAVAAAGAADASPLSFVANPNPWSTWTMALDWPPPTYTPSALVLDSAKVAVKPVKPARTTIDYSQWRWDPRVLRADTQGADTVHDEPQFAEPDFPRTGIADVDDQIRQGILDRLREQWELERAERAASLDAQKQRLAAQARARREEAVMSVTTAAAAAQKDADAVSKIALLNAAVAAARRLEPFLEPELSLAETVARWDVELSEAEDACFGTATSELAAGGAAAAAAAVSERKPSGADDSGDGSGPAEDRPTACGKCGGIVGVGDKFCPYCGHPVQQQQRSHPTDEWEIARSRIAFPSNKALGEGEFGEVKKGLLDDSTEVAVKTAKKQVRAFLAEAGKMKKLKHRNIVELYGVCTVGEPALIVLEFARSGCVLDFLRINHKRIATSLQCSMCADVACGLAYLQKTHWIHGDLAARNLLVAGDMAAPETIVVKICDFGHAMQTDEFNTPILVSRQLAFRWTAPELYEFRRSSPETDIWSFGIVVYEILSGGRTPYWEIENNKDVMRNIQNGWRMHREKTVWKQFYEMMIACWHKEPSKRPKPQCVPNHMLLMQA
mmetsp:Transcript_8567/g.22085  ORF Transcript_8567/g.22085 Transcript_8567/m.22085 type:complete len:651 (-) Transcript_8567:1044-2996(-)